MSVVVVSGGFDPVHVGHLQMFEEASKLGDKLIVILNNSLFLKKKKGYEFMPLQERKEILENLVMIDEVVISVDKDQSVQKTLKKINKNQSISIFANGGDRTNKNDILEADVCDELGINMVFGVGGSKVQSSSNLINPLIDKPWGNFKLLAVDNSYKVKEILIKPGECISLQKHYFRDEHWLLVKGKIRLELNNKEIILNAGDTAFIPSQKFHRASNEENEDAVLIEIQLGEKLLEEDIIRKDDKYGRK